MCELSLVQLEHEIVWKPFAVPLDSLHERTSFDVIQFSQVHAEHDLLPAQKKDPLLNALDRRFWIPCRPAIPTPVGGCPSPSCIADGTPGSYNPWDGVIFDLSASANQVAVFGANDHGSQPCESLG